MSTIRHRRGLAGTLLHAIPLALLIGALVPNLAHSAELKPYTARYNVTFHGLGAGVLEFSLQAGSTPGTFTYNVRAEPSLLARLVVSSNALESSRMEIAGADVRPLEYTSDDGSKSGA